MTNQTKSPNSRPMTTREWTLLLLLGAIWGGAFFFARIAVAEIPPLNLVFFRVAIAAVALHIYLAFAGPSFRLALPMAGSFVGLALLNNIIPFSLMFLGQTELGAGAASILNATTPFWTMILANLFTSDEKLSANKLIGVAIGMVGAAVMIGPGVIADLGAPAWAKLALVGTAVSYAFATIYGRRFRSLPVSVVATGQITAGAIVMIPVVLITHGTQGLFTASPPAWSAVLALALLATSVAYIIYFSLLGSAGATNTSLVTFIVPVSAIVLGALFLNERLETFEFAGMALIAVGLMVIDGRLFRRK
jgi:drug/metabolite transporter (DMT)-like permease